MDHDETVAQIKAEPGEKEESRKERKAKAPMNELPILGEDELRKFRKDELLADVVHLQGDALLFLRPRISHILFCLQSKSPRLDRTYQFSRSTSSENKNL